VSISGGISKAVDNALHMGCSAFQIFSRNPKGWSANPLQQQEVENFKTKLKKCGIRRDCVCVHMPYLPNLSSPNKSLYEKSVKVLIEELRRCSALGIPYLVLHFGSNLGVGKESGVSQFVNACSLALENYASSSLSSESAVFSTSSSRKLPKRPKGTSEKEAEQKGFDKVTILLENNVGHKNTIGSRFEDIRLILDKLNSFQSLIGVCLDSCHAYAAGYDLGSKAAVESTLEKFDNIIGLKNLKLVHLNDSRDGLGSNLDRHENLGLGKIGNEGIGALCTHNSISSVPFIMETPREKHGEDMITIRSIVNKLQT
jgi:deoxyribonuclease-4